MRGATRFHADLAAYDQAMATPRGSISLIAAPFDSGLRQRMGRGPDWLLEHGLAERMRDEGYDVDTTVIGLGDTYPSELAVGFLLHRSIADAATGARTGGRLPVALTGNCNSGVIGCLTAALRTTAERPGLVWFDAHSDCRVPETIRDGFLDSMGLSMAMGRCWQGALAQLDGFAPPAAGHALHVGSRHLDGDERAELATADVAVVGAGDVELGATGRLARELESLDRQADEVHLHLDVDAYDSSIGQANEWAATHGLDEAQYLGAVELVVARCNVRSVSLASYDPAADETGTIGASAIELLAASARAAEKAGRQTG